MQPGFASTIKAGITAGSMQHDMQALHHSHHTHALQIPAGLASGSAHAQQQTGKALTRLDGSSHGDSAASILFTTDRASVLVQSSRGQAKAAEQQPRFSLLDGSYHAAHDAGQHQDEASQDGASTALAKRAQHALQVSGGSCHGLGWDRMVQRAYCCGTLAFVLSQLALHR